MTVIITIYGECYLCRASDTETILTAVRIGHYRLKQCLIRKSCESRQRAAGITPYGYLPPQPPTVGDLGAVLDAWREVPRYIGRGIAALQRHATRTEPTE